MRLRATSRHHRIESLRVLLAIIAELMLIDVASAVQTPLSMAVLAFSLYAITLLWAAATGLAAPRERIFCWLDASWFLLFLSLAGEARTTYFLFLFFPVIFAAWRIGYRESVKIAGFSGLATLIIFALQQPGIPLPRLLALPLSLLVVGPLFMKVAWMDAAVQKGQMFAASIVENFNPRRSTDAVIADLLVRIAREFGATAAQLVTRPLDDRCRLFRWTATDGPSEETSATAARTAADQAFLPASDMALGWLGAHHWWARDRLIGLDASHTPLTPTKADRDTLIALTGLPGNPPLLSVAHASPGVGRMRLILAGPALQVDPHTLDILLQVVEQIAPSVENAYLRERLVKEAAETERARIGRDLHDSAIQPYIGLKFALEAVQRRAGPDNPVTPELSHLVETATGELAAMREIISGLRGVPGKGGALLLDAVRRQAERFGQLFGMKVDVDVDTGLAVSRYLASEMFHIVAEGLSNIRRHTQSRHAWIALKSEDDQLVLRIRNENDARLDAAADFTPRSLTERAVTLGGSLDIERDAIGTTVVVRVPLPTGGTRDT